MAANRFKLLLILSCMGGVLLFFACKYTYEQKVAELKEKARKAFVEAFEQELKNRNVEGPTIFNVSAKSMIAAEIPDSVCMRDSLGAYWFKLDSEKHQMNITDYTNIRSLHSVLIQEKPIQCDSLGLLWRKQLTQSNIDYPSALRISITKRNNVVDVLNTPQSEWCASSFLVFTLYIGYACEIEVMGYLQYSWWNIIFVYVISYLLLYTLCVYILYRLCIIALERLKKIRQKKVVIVQEVNSTLVRSYKLRHNIIFYAELQTLEVNEEMTKLPSQLNQLLELFLLEKEYLLTDDFIKNNMWPDGSGSMERMHKVVGRLRLALKKVDASIDILRGTENYQLLL